MALRDEYNPLQLYGTQDPVTKRRSHCLLSYTFAAENSVSMRNTV
jgi:hypothetical protein